MVNTFFLRIAARCNLACDYCYVFKHRDKSSENMPPTMHASTVTRFAERLKEYTIHHDLTLLNIIFHGGEPLICGERQILGFVDIINDTLGPNVCACYSLQTNGTLISESFLQACETKKIGISLSIDGPKNIHDKHRKYKTGKGSYDDVIHNLDILKKHPSVFEGIIGVIDPYFDPETTLQFFDHQKIENIDLLLPDATYMDLPEGRENNPELYKRWLLHAFDAWFFNHQSIRLRTFEHLLLTAMGSKSSLDAFGGGTLDYLTIETDGSYHTSDILKVAYENASSIGFGVFDDTIECALSHEKVKQYNELLRQDRLPDKCKQCEYSNICRGGALPHRYNEKNGFNNPSVYCTELHSLIHHSLAILTDILDNDKHHAK